MLCSKGGYNLSFTESFDTAPSILYTIPYVETLINLKTDEEKREKRYKLIAPQPLTKELRASVDRSCIRGEKRHDGGSGEISSILS